MAVFTLQSLVLRGVSVAVCDGQNVGLRLGAESQTAGRTPEVRINPRHPSLNWQRGFMPARRPDDHAEYDRTAASAAYGAGRSRSWDGSLSRRSPARIAGATIPSGWCKSHGSLQATAAKRLSLQDRRNAVGNAATTSARLCVAGRTPSASTWAS